MQSYTAARPETAANVAPSIERARPLLGTIVSLRTEGLPSDHAHSLADAAFAEIALIHDLMSFQEAGSELNRINRDASRCAVSIHPHTRACLAHSLDLAERSGGVFDPVRAGGSWRDIVLGDDHVCTAVPLRIDLSGIAKGYAVDCAGDILRAGGAAAAMVNAGGDLYLFGPTEETIILRPSEGAEPAMLTISDGAVASSDPASSHFELGASQHFNGCTGSPVQHGFVTVCAPKCIDADALTKVVLAQGDEASSLLRALNAIAHIHDGRSWRSIGATGGKAQ